MRNYEIMYIIRPSLTEEDRKALIESLNTIFDADESEIKKTDEWGLRDLAYEIDKESKGYYVVMDVTATEAVRTEFDRVIGLREDVLRYLIVKEDE